METSVLSTLPNLSIGVVSVLALVYTARECIKHVGAVNENHLNALKEREDAMRQVEKEVRTSIMTQLGENTAVMKDIIKIHNITK